MRPVPGWWLALTVVTWLPTGAQAQDSIAGALAAAHREEAHVMWTAILKAYDTGRLKTEVDFMRPLPGVGKFRKGHAPRQLRFKEGIASSDSAWVNEMIADSLVDAACAGKGWSECDGKFVTLFLTLHMPTLTVHGATVAVDEAAFDPERCRKNDAFVGYWMRQFTLERQDTLWSVRSVSADMSGSGNCRMDE